MSAVEYLRKAAGFLKRDGWCQGRSKNEVGQCCLYGVLMEAIPVISNDFHECADRVRQVVEQIAEEPNMSFLQWNDRPGRTAEEVIAVLEKAASMENYVPIWKQNRKNS